MSLCPFCLSSSELAAMAIGSLVVCTAVLLTVVSTASAQGLRRALYCSRLLQPIPMPRRRLCDTFPICCQQGKGDMSPEVTSTGPTGSAPSPCRCQCDCDKEPRNCKCKCHCLAASTAQKIEASSSINTRQMEVCYVSDFNLRYHEKIKLPHAHRARPPRPCTVPFLGAQYVLHSASATG